MSSEQMQYDILIVGGGPAGLACGIHCKQQNQQLSIAVLEKAASMGGHSVSGAVLEVGALDELLPDWETSLNLHLTPVTRESMQWLTSDKACKIPAFLLPRLLHNRNNVMISLSELCRELAKEAERLGVDVFPGFNAKQLHYDHDRVMGVMTGDMGVAKDGSQKPEYAEGILIHAKFTVLAEGCRGVLSQSVMDKFDLNNNRCPQLYGLGIKEVWEVDSDHYQPGLVQHTMGWPLPNSVYGGGFIYHMDKQKVSLGLVTSLDYNNPYLDPFAKMQRFKTHPAIKPLLANGKRIAYAARTITEGGVQALPNLTFPGGLLIGCSAGLVNVAKIKGIHNAIRSGMLAATCLTTACETARTDIMHYESDFKQSRIYKELYQVRNLRYYVKKWGFLKGILLGGFDLLLRGNVPWTLKQYTSDRESLKKARQFNSVEALKPDQEITFSRLASLALANIRYDENQPVHLQICDQVKQQQVISDYAAPELRYCPAGVYELSINQNGEKKIIINAANCIHCKACDIKDPLANIRWTLPEGGSGPNYTET